MRVCRGNVIIVLLAAISVGSAAWWLRPLAPAASWRFETLPPEPGLPDLFEIAHAHSSAYSPDGTLFAAFRGSDAVVWDVETKIERGRLQGNSPGTALVFSPDSLLLATTHASQFPGADVDLRIWKISSMELWFEAKTERRFLTYSAPPAFSGNGRYLTANHQLWDLATTPPSQAEPRERITWFASTVIFSPDSRWIVTTGTSDQHYIVFHAEPFSKHFALRADLDARLLGPPVFSPDGRALVISLDEPRRTFLTDCFAAPSKHIPRQSVTITKLFDVETGREVASVPGLSLGFVSDGKAFLTSVAQGRGIFLRHRWQLPLHRSKRPLFVSLISFLLLLAALRYYGRGRKKLAYNAIAEKKHGD